MHLYKNLPFIILALEVIVKTKETYNPPFFTVCFRLIKRKRKRYNTRKNRSELYLKYDDSLNISVEYTRFYITEILIILVLNTENNVLLRHAVSST